MTEKEKRKEIQQQRIDKATNILEKVWRDWEEEDVEEYPWQLESFDSEVVWLSKIKFTK